MKKLIIKFLILLIPVMIFTMVFNRAYWRADTFGTNKFQNVPNDIEICNLGSSYGLLDFDYENYKDRYTTFNFALTSQSPIYDYLILDYYKAKLKRGGVCIFPVGYNTFIGIDEIQREDFDSMNRRYYTMLPPKTIRKYSFATDLQVNFIPFSYCTGIRQLFVQLFSQEILSDWDELGMKIADRNEVVISAEREVKNHLIKNRLDESGHLIYWDDAMAAIYKCINLCKENGITPILVTTPLTQEYLDQAKKINYEYCSQKFPALIAKIQNDTGVEYCNYSSDERFLNDYDLFADSVHLNKAGARKFTNILFEEIVKNHLS